MDIYEQFNKLNGDINRWKWLIAHKDEDLIILLDNDETYVSFPDQEEWCAFDHHIGNSHGVALLLCELGLNSDGV